MRLPPGAKWFPYNKGNFRKWYGMNEYVVNWENGGGSVKALYKSCFYAMNRTTLKLALHGLCLGLKILLYATKQRDFYLTFQVLLCFLKEEQTAELLGFLCSKVAFYFLSLLAPTVNFSSRKCGRLANTPLMEQRETFVRLVEENCRISKEDWDCFENQLEF